MIYSVLDSGAHSAPHGSRFCVAYTSMKKPSYPRDSSVRVRGWGRGIRASLRAAFRCGGSATLRASRRTLARSLCSAPLRVRIPGRRTKKPSHPIDSSVHMHGWGRGIRTPVTGTKNRGPAAGRCPIDKRRRAPQHFGATSVPNRSTHRKRRRATGWRGLANRLT